MKLHAEIMGLAGADPDLPDSEPGTLAFRMAGTIPLDLDFKQALLAMRSEAKRVQTVITYFETLLPNLRRAVRVKQKASGNGARTLIFTSVSFPPSNPRTRFTTPSAHAVSWARRARSSRAISRGV